MWAYLDLEAQTDKLLEKDHVRVGGDYIQAVYAIRQELNPFDGRPLIAHERGSGYHFFALRRLYTEQYQVQLPDTRNDADLDVALAEALLKQLPQTDAGSRTEMANFIGFVLFEHGDNAPLLQSLKALQPDAGKRTAAHKAVELENHYYQLALAEFQQASAEPSHTMPASVLFYYQGEIQRRLGHAPEAKQAFDRVLQDANAEPVLLKWAREQESRL